jgi:hypothetical protein
LSPSTNPYGYCNHGPDGLTCPVGVARTSSAACRAGGPYRLAAFERVLQE